MRKEILTTNLEKQKKKKKQIRTRMGTYSQAVEKTLVRCMLLRQRGSLTVPIKSPGRNHATKPPSNNCSSGK
jgi:hypothetical protein